ncbi:MAG: helix-turn-helix transcriptional regulator [Vicinamibacterales bacterium]|jgi:DNA-binding PadR family transcriptional regulator
MATPPPYIGEFEYSVLLAVLHFEGGDDAYAVPIRALLEDRTARPVARGALYTALERLETKGCLRSRMGDPTAERGGKARRYFTVTAVGVKAIRAMHASLANLSRGLEAILEQP